MKITYNRLKEFINTDLSIHELAHKLTMSGLEVEDIQYIKNNTDAVIELDITPNRSDCLSILGIAREVSALTGCKITLPECNAAETGGPIHDLVSVTITAPQQCFRYCARVISGVTIGPSPQWLQERLHALDIKSINNVVDITNLVLTELGHPLHAFDYDKIAGKKIIVRPAAGGERFTSLDRTEYTLTSDMLVICDEEKPAALAGIVGGADSGVGDDAKNILLEAAVFEPVCIRKTSKQLGIHTESSHRFERGVDHEGIIRAINRTALLVNRIAGGDTAEGIIDIYPSPLEASEITVRVDRINKILSTDLGIDTVEKYLNRLSLHTTTRAADTAPSSAAIAVDVPSFRKDVTREIDVIEEVARLHGYNNIPSEMPLSHLTSSPENRYCLFEQKVKTLLSIKGLNEVVNYAFTSESLCADINAMSPSQSEQAVKLKNPLTNEYNIMRTTLLPGLLRSAALNARKGAADIAIFETGKIFYSDHEENMLACAVTRNKKQGLWTKKGDERSFFDIKGIIEAVLTHLRIDNYTFSGAEHPLLIKKCSAALYIDNTRSGIIGEIHPSVLERFDLNDAIYACEINLDRVFTYFSREITVTPVPRYPALLRDVALIVDKQITSYNILAAFRQAGTSILKEITIFDRYEGKPIPPAKKSLAYSLKYRADDRTLTDEEVDAVHDTIIESLKKRLGATFRD